MERKPSIGITVGAALGRSFNTTFGALEDRTKAARKRLAQLKVGEKAAKDVIKYSKTLKELKARQAALGRSSPQLERGIERVQQLYRKAKSSAKQYGFSIKDIGRNHKNLTREIGRTEKQLAKLQRRQRVRAGIKDARGKIVAGIGAAAGAAGAFSGAFDLERGVTRLGTVANTKKVGQALEASQRDALAFARRGLADEREVLDIEYALNSAGLEADAARVGARIVSKVATVTGGMPERVGEVIATTFNNLGATLEGTSEERLNRVADLMTKTQFKFQIRDFGQLGESMKLATATLSQYGVELDQGLTLIGELNSAGLQGTMAGTALANVFNKLSKASEEYGFQLARNKRGGIDFIATMENMEGAVGDFNKLDQEMIDRLAKTFGEQGIRGFDALSKKLHQLRDDQKDVAEGSRDIVDEKYAEFLKTAGAQWQRLTGNIRRFGVSVATALIPVLEPTLEFFADIVGKVGEAIDQAPLIGAALGVAVTGFGLYKTAVFAAAIMTGNYGKAVDIVTLKSIPRALTRLKALAVQSLVTGKAMNAASIGGVAKGLAARAGLVGLAGAAGAAIGTVIYKTQLEGTEVGQAIGHSVASVLAFAGVESAKEAIAADERARNAQAARLKEPVRKRDTRVDKILAPAGQGAGQPGGRGRAAAIQQDNRSENTVNVYAAPGMNEKELADQTARQLRAMDEEKAARARGALFDPAFAG